MLIFHRKVASLAKMENYEPHISMSFAPIDDYTSYPLQLGEEIYFTLSITNDGNCNLKNVVVRCELTGDEWSRYSNFLTNEIKQKLTSFRKGTTITLPSVSPSSHSSSYVITEDDILNEDILFQVTVFAETPDENEPEYNDELEYSIVDDGEMSLEEQNLHCSVQYTEISTPANGERYALGEHINYSATITNDGNLSIYNLTLATEPSGDEYYPIQSSQSLGFEPNDSRTFSIQYSITESNILEGNITTATTVSGYDFSHENEVDCDISETEFVVDEPNSSVSIALTPTSSPANGTSWTAGEIIYYNFDIVNDGNLTLTGGNYSMNVYASATDDTGGNGRWGLASFKPDDSYTWSSVYEVTAADVSSGTISIPIYTIFASPDPGINYEYEEVHWTDIPVNVA